MNEPLCKVESHIFLGLLMSQSARDNFQSEFGHIQSCLRENGASKSQKCPMTQTSGSPCCLWQSRWFPTKTCPSSCREPQP